MSEIIRDLVLSLLSYERDTGNFIWIVSPTLSVPAGAIAGSIDKDGYVCISIKNKKYKAHRLAWFVCYGEFPDGLLDHVNGVKNDNRIENLRMASPSLNCENKRAARVDNKSGFLGVNQKDGKWLAQIQVKGKKKFIGYFSSPEIAHAKYLEAKRALHEGCSI